MSLTQLREALDVWRGKNPLRVWRTKHKWTQGEVADVIGVSEQSVRMYERGRYRPVEDTMATIAIVMRRDYRKMNQEWTRWLNKRPLPKQ